LLSLITHRTTATNKTKANTIAIVVVVLRLALALFRRNAIEML
jgi:hypothetical protein